jgi:hypothetical protein
MISSLKIIFILSLFGFCDKTYGQSEVREIIAHKPTCNGEKKEVNKKYPLQSKAQLDTLNYLKQFEINKKNYIGQPFSKLLNDMKFAKPSMMRKRPIHGIVKLVSATIFCFNKRCPFDSDNAGCLSITWEESLHYRDSGYRSLEEKNNNYFTKDEESFFDSKIVKDIQVYRR